MKLDALLSKFLPVAASVRAAAPDISTVADDSRAVTPGCLFVARAGTRTDGRRFVADAVARGAVAVLHAGEDPCAGDPAASGVVRVQVPEGTDLARLAGRLADVLEGNPSEWLRLVGITGTNGKTTMAFLVQQFVRAAGSPCGVIGTVVIDDGAVAVPANLTTPGGIETAQALGRMVRNGCTACAMEVSSHALDQGRADALRFRTAIFSNLTGDHLDYHGTMENYAAAKAGLIGFTKSLAREVASRNITVNAVAPGFIDTDMTRALDDTQRATLAAGIPLARLGEPADIAAAVLYLVAPSGAYLTGQTLHVNGGLYMP